VRAKKIDANHNEVADYLRAIGWGVSTTAALGNGFPDLLVYRPGFAALVEVKDGSLPPSARKLTDHEEKFREKYTGPYVLALSGEDAAMQLGKLWRKS
jgi:hypothetical protein